MRIVHVISNLHIGGAEILLKDTINLLPEHEHFVIYFRKPDDLLKEIQFVNEAVCLNQTSWRQLFSSIKKIRQLLAKWKPDIVHAHLFESTYITRLAIPSNINLISTIHSTYSIDAFHNNKKALWAERLTVHKQKALIGVSKFVLDDYLEHVQFKGKTFVLHNFLPSINQLDPFKKKQNNSELRCVAVGNLKEAKNYEYLLDVFKLLKDQNISLDIYGEGPLKSDLKSSIISYGLNVNLKGISSSIRSDLLGYDLFIQASKHEGFGISVIEAMALKLPVLLADIPVFKEVTNDLAHFFTLKDASIAADTVKEVISNKNLRSQFVESAYKYVKEHYSEKAYSEKLLNIYQQVAGINSLQNLI